MRYNIIFAERNKKFEKKKKTIRSIERERERLRNGSFITLHYAGNGTRDILCLYLILIEPIKRGVPVGAYIMQ